MNITTIYNAALRADDKFRAELVRVFGKKQAGDMRYRRDSWPEDARLERAFNRWKRANDRWLKVMRTRRPAGS
jgi:hypothetical protein